MMRRPAHATLKTILGGACILLVPILFFTLLTSTKQEPGLSVSFSHVTNVAGLGYNCFVLSNTGPVKIKVLPVFRYNYPQAVVTMDHDFTNQFLEKHESALVKVKTIPNPGPWQPVFWFDVQHNWVKKQLAFARSHWFGGNPLPVRYYSSGAAMQNPKSDP